MLLIKELKIIDFSSVTDMNITIERSHGFQLLDSDVIYLKYINMHTNFIFPKHLIKKQSSSVKVLISISYGKCILNTILQVTASFIII